jgi:hypothetical protein
MKRTLWNRRNSGQTLIITALVISLLILSVVYGVFEAERRNEMRSATNLNSYVEAVGSQSYFGKCNVFFTALNASPYQSGMYLSWDTDGTGVSSAYANYTLVFTKIESEIHLEHVTNITTGLEVEGTYSKLGGTSKQVNVTCGIFNEGEPALANNITLYYEYDGDPSNQEWIAASSPTTTDYGNGTYKISFVADTQTSDDPMLVSARVYDVRDIFVLANATCTET